MNRPLLDSATDCANKQPFYNFIIEACIIFIAIMRIKYRLIKLFS